MHIALYSPAWPLGHIPSGIVTYVNCMRTALISQGHRVSVFARSVSPIHEDENIYLVSDPLRCRILRRLARFIGRPQDSIFAWGEVIGDAMATVHRRDPIDIVEMEESFGWCAAVQERLGVPVVAKLHGPAFLTTIGKEAESQFSIGRVFHEGKALERVSAVMSPSRCTLDETVRRYGQPPGLLCHVPNPLLLAKGAAVWSLDHCARDTVVFVGRFDMIKGGDIMIRAFAQLLDRYPDKHLIFIGPDDGLFDDTGARRNLMEYARSILGATRMTSIDYRGKLDAAEIYLLRTRALITVVASRWENQCYAALEAMAQGCPLICTNTGGASEIIEHDVTGLLCPAEDPSELCRGMSRLFADTNLCERLGYRSRNYVLAAHEPTIIARRTIDVYERAIAAYRIPAK